MKTTALLLMLLGGLFTAGMGFVSLFVLAMSFDAPASANNPAEWSKRILIILTVVLATAAFVAAQVFAWKAYQSGDYRRSVWIGSMFGLVAITTFGYLLKQSYDDIRGANVLAVNAYEVAQQFPDQEFMRPSAKAGKGTDTIIVFSNGFLTYRLYDGDEVLPLAGPVGDLTPNREAIVLNFLPDSKINRGELSQFVDGQGRKLTDLYRIQ